MKIDEAKVSVVMRITFCVTQGGDGKWRYSINGLPDAYYDICHSDEIYDTSKQAEAAGREVFDTLTSGENIMEA